jgi:hypothetical protein
VHSRTERASAAVASRHSVWTMRASIRSRMCQGHPENLGAAVILHVKRVAQEPARFGEVIHVLGVVSAEDKMIPPEAQCAMSQRAGSRVVDLKGSHSL